MTIFTRFRHERGFDMNCRVKPEEHTHTLWRAKSCKIWHVGFFVYQEVLPGSKIRCEVTLRIEGRCVKFCLLLSPVSPFVSTILPRENLQKSSQKSRLCTTRHFQRLRNCHLGSFDVIEKIHASPDLDCASKTARNEYEIRGSG